MTIAEVITRCGNNTASLQNKSEQGIFFFARYFFPDQFSNAFSVTHYRIVQMIFSLYHENKTLSIDRQAYLLSHREAAKSTISTFLLPLFFMCMKGHRVYWRDENNDMQSFIVNEKFIVIASETSAQAERFVTNLKNAFDMNAMIASVFGEKKPSLISEDDLRKADIKWTKTAFVTADGTVLLGVGAGQQIRGVNVHLSRPTMILVDDMYSRNNTGTERIRRKVADWFHDDLCKSLDSQLGKIMWMGTMVHPDTVVKDFRSNTDWFGVECPVISKDELAILVSRAIVDDMIDVAECEILDKELTTFSWLERANSRYIAKHYLNSVKRNNLNGFYQEFMNETVADGNKMINSDNFERIPIEYSLWRGKPTVEFRLGNTMWKGVVTLIMGVDPAASSSMGSDDTVIVVAGYARCFPHVDGVDWNTTDMQQFQGQIFPVIMHIEGGKYTIIKYKDEQGMADRIYDLSVKFKLNNIRIEANGQQMLIVNEVRKFFQERGSYTPITEEYNSIKKEERILTTILPIVQRYDKFIVSEYVTPTLIQKLIMQMLTLGFNDHDDYPDALAIAMHDIQQPSIENPYNDRPNKTTTRDELLDHPSMWEFR